MGGGLGEVVGLWDRRSGGRVCGVLVELMDFVVSMVVIGGI